jgi:heterodisulfide reductase subunit A
MKVGIYLCGCGSLISGMVGVEAIREAVRSFPEDPFVTAVDFICSADGEARFVAALQREQPDRVVIAACSPRDHEATFRRCLSSAGINPYLLQTVNLREQIVWVTPDPREATEKAIRALSGAVNRVKLQEPLEVIEREVCSDTLVIGAGPAGLKAALALAAAGRRVILVERGAAIGGLPVSFEKVFSTMECSVCMLEPAMMEVLHGEYAANIELITLADVKELNGYYGNFHVTLRQRARHVSLTRCIGCGECVAVCPAIRNNGRRAIDFDYAGALPSVPFLDEASCLRFRGGACQLCSGVCPVATDVISYGDGEELLEREVGAVIVATGAGLYDSSRVAGLGYGTLPDVYDSLQFQNILSTNSPGGGAITTRNGSSPASIAIIHCVGSLDRRHIPYCSGICCQYALTFSSQITAQLPDTMITHYHRELVLPGKQGSALHQKLRDSRQITFIRYSSMDELAVSSDDDGGMGISLGGAVTPVDMVILCSAMVPGEGAAGLAIMLDAPVDSGGFFQELHDRMDACSSSMKGIYPVGTCREPMDIQRAVNEGLAAAALVQAGLQPGRKIIIEPIHAEVDASHCSGCHLCLSTCPYRAITFDAHTNSAVVNPLLCRGCGVCVAACPASAIRGLQFTDEQIMSEIKGHLV